MPQSKKKSKGRKQQKMESQRFQSQVMAAMNMMNPYMSTPANNITGSTNTGFIPPPPMPPGPNQSFYPPPIPSFGNTNNNTNNSNFPTFYNPPPPLPIPPPVSNHQGISPHPSGHNSVYNNNNNRAVRGEDITIEEKNLHQKPSFNPIEKYGIKTPNRVAADPKSVYKIHIYDFDNTLFRTPLPNPDLLSTSAMGILESLNGLHGGGWWADSRFLLGTGKGYKAEKDTAWEGWWNEKVVELAKLSWEDPESLCILLSGRKSSAFTHAISNMVEAKGLKFNAIILRREEKSQDESTLQFKNRVIVDLLKYFDRTNSITIYEDRPKQANGFRRTLKHVSSVVRPDLIYEVVEVYEPQTYLDPLVERELIEGALNTHNNASSKGLLSKNTRNARVELMSDVVYSGYILDKKCSRELLKLLFQSGLVDPPKAVGPSNSVKFDGEAIITNSKGKLPSNMANDLGKRVSWKVTHIGQHGYKIWAVQVAPVDETQNIMTERKVPVIILAIKRKTNPNEVVQITNWIELPEDYSPMVINTTVGEKTLLKMNTFPRAKNNVPKNQK